MIFAPTTLEMGPARTAIALVAALGLALVATRANAGPIDEVWVGGFAHDVTNAGQGVESNTQDVVIEVDTKRPSVLRFLGAPRLNAVIALNSAGETNFGSVGLVWDHRIFSRLYGSLDFGVGLTDGVADPAPGPAADYDERHRLVLGSKVLFREAAGLDWRLTRSWSIGAEFIHASNGGVLGSHRFNRGINDAGLRLGYRFR
jgi:lipid A 3-O-deacylase